MPPFLAINTTAGTASEMTRFCIITNTETHVKMAIVDWRVTPNVAINDPVLMAGMPPALTAATGMDALTHAIEAYVSTIATPITDACAIKAIELIRDYLPSAVANGKNMEARDRMAYAEYLAGMAFNNASLGYVHAMAHQLGGFYNLPHGVCNAILLPTVCDFNLIACPKRYRNIAIALGQDVTGLSDLDAGAKGIQAIRQLSRTSGHSFRACAAWCQGRRSGRNGDQCEERCLPVHQPSYSNSATGGQHLHVGDGNARSRRGRHSRCRITAQPLLSESGCPHRGPEIGEELACSLPE